MTAYGGPSAPIVLDDDIGRTSSARDSAVGDLNGSPRPGSTSDLVSDAHGILYHDGNIQIINFDIFLNHTRFLDCQVHINPVNPAWKANLTTILL